MEKYTRSETTSWIISTNGPDNNAGSTLVNEAKNGTKNPIIIAKFAIRSILKNKIQLNPWLNINKCDVNTVITPKINPIVFPTIKSEKNNL